MSSIDSFCGYWPDKINLSTISALQVIINISENLFINGCRKETQIQFDHSLFMKWNWIILYLTNIFQRLWCILYKALTWKMNYLYLFNLTKLRYKGMLIYLYIPLVWPWYFWYKCDTGHPSSGVGVINKSLILIFSKHLWSNVVQN